MRRLIATVLACLLLAAPAIADTPPSPESITVKAGKTERGAILYAPETGQGSLPVVLVFHGGGGSADLMADKSADLTRTLSAAGYVVVYMNGSARRRTKNLRTWNAVHCCAYAAKAKVNDAAYADAVIETLDARLDIDRTRIFLLGHSNGAMLSYRIASEMANAPRGIASVSGGLFADQPDLPDRTSVFMYHAVDDDRVSFEADPNGKSAYQRTAPHLGFVATETALASLKQCGAPAASSFAGGMKMTERACPGASSLVAVIAPSGGHDWPARPPGYAIETALLDFFGRQR